MEDNGDPQSLVSLKLDESGDKIMIEGEHMETQVVDMLNLADSSEHDED